MAASIYLGEQPQEKNLDWVISHLPKSAHARFRDLITPALWEAALKYKLDFIGMAAQTAVETGWGNFPSAARPEFHNTCGLKWHDEFRVLYADTTGNQPRAHAVFANWRVGAEAHAQHLCAYLRIVLFKWQVIVDPRFNDAFNKVVQGEVEHWEDLTNRWAAPAKPGEETYGSKIIRIRTNLRLGSY